MGVAMGVAYANCKVGARKCARAGIDAQATLVSSWQNNQANPGSMRLFVAAAF